MRGGTTPQQERSSATIPVSVTAAGSRATPSQLVPVDPRLQERDRTLVSSDRWVTCQTVCGLVINSLFVMQAVNNNSGLTYSLVNLHPHLHQHPFKLLNQQWQPLDLFNNLMFKFFKKIIWVITVYEEWSVSSGKSSIKTWFPFGQSPIKVHLLRDVQIFSRMADIYRSLHGSPLCSVFHHGKFTESRQQLSDHERCVSNYNQALFSSIQLSCPQYPSPCHPRNEFILFFFFFFSQHSSGCAPSQRKS